MSLDPKTFSGAHSSMPVREKGVRIFTYPKIIFMFPTLAMAIVCWIGMLFLGGSPGVSNSVSAKEKAEAKVTAPAEPKAVPSDDFTPSPQRFKRKENLLGLLFLGIFFFNLLILAIDFPRFTIFALLLFGTTLLFFLLWLGMFVSILDPLLRVVEGFYVTANAQFYFLTALLLLAVYGVIFITRWLDYWEVFPNEILHHHGPLSDLERYPTMNLKFDKEIPDVFEHLMFGAGRLVLHVASENKAIVLDTVLHVSRKEESLKKLMSRMEVRVTTDQEVAN
jgi:hypothetical protein